MRRPEFELYRNWQWRARLFVDQDSQVWLTGRLGRVHFTLPWRSPSEAANRRRTDDELLGGILRRYLAERDRRTYVRRGNSWDAYLRLDGGVELRSEHEAVAVGRVWGKSKPGDPGISVEVEFEGGPLDGQTRVFEGGAAPKRWDDQYTLSGFTYWHDSANFREDVAEWCESCRVWHAKDRHALTYCKACGEVHVIGKHTK